MHGGKISAISEGEGKGSTFVVKLPLVELQLQHAISAAPPSEPQGEDAALDVDKKPDGLFEGTKVLVVEDNADSRELLCEVLELAGHRCRAADSSAAALTLVEQERPDAMIIDIGLPGIDGFELARRIRDRADCADAYLIALTGYGQPSDRESGQRAGFDAHLVKPVDVEELLGLLGKLRRKVPSPIAARGH
jgi:CheY-like chemotaxis protein